MDSGRAASRKTAGCVGELVGLVGPDSGEGSLVPPEAAGPPGVTVTCCSGESLEHLGDRWFDAVVMDPPNCDNVLYTELADFI